jgi:hypothetical protein
LIHTTTSSSALNPWFITGFADAESCFTLSVVKNNKMKAGWHVKQSFQIGLHQKDKAILEQIKTYLGVGNIYKQGLQLLQFRVDSLKDLKFIINHFDKYPLITQKFADYNLFKQAIQLMEQKEHLTKEGLQKIVSIKAVLNNGLSDSLKAAFPDLIPVPRPQVVDQEIKDPH